MEKVEFLDELITKYSFDEIDAVYKLCITYYTSETGHELSDQSKASLKAIICERPSLAQIRDNIYTFIKMYENKF